LFDSFLAAIVFPPRPEWGFELASLASQPHDSGC